MKIKGTTKIELTDVRTGKKETYTHENELTEFSVEYFRECGALNWNPLGDISASYPLDTLFGGIMLFKRPILTNSETYPTRKPLYLPAGNEMTANGCIDNQANSQQGVTELGQYNEAESSASEDTRTYVYDWDTNEANGEISCICLTTRAGGYIGAGNATSGNVDLTLLTRYWSAYPGSTSSGRTIDDDTRLRLAALDIGNAQVATITTDAAAALQAGSVTVNWYDAPVSKLNPFENINTFKDYKTVEGVKILNTPRRSETHAFTSANVSAGRVMGGTGYILLVGSDSGNIQNGSAVTARQINKDGTVTEFSATLAGMNGTIVLTEGTYKQFIGGEIIDGALYLAGGQEAGGDTVRVKIASDGTVTNLTQGSDYDRVFMTQEKRVYLGATTATGARWYDTDTGEIMRANSVGWHNNPIYGGGLVGLWNCYDSPCLFVCMGQATRGDPGVSPLSILRPPCNWLSTINNLDNTVTKTGTQTMKISYTLTLYRA